jgi:hypothetical protein
MGVLINMFTQLARLGVTRAAAFFYAVAVGVVANVVIAHFSPHPGDTQAVTEPIALKSTDAPVATALIGPKPTQPPVQTLDVSAPAAPPVAMPVATNASAATALPKTPPPPDVSTSATLPDASVITASPLVKPAAPPDAPVAAEPVAAAPAVVTVPDNKPATNVEAAAGSTPSAPISLLPQADPPASEQPTPKPAKPGPGSGGLY